MPEGANRWTVSLGGEASRDLEGICVWTAQVFGAEQAAVYKNALTGLIVSIGEDPFRNGSKSREEIGPNLRTLHMRSIRLRGSHLAVYRVDDLEVLIVRILHERMDLARHIPPGNDA